MYWKIIILAHQAVITIPTTTGSTLRNDKGEQNMLELLIWILLIRAGIEQNSGALWVRVCSLYIHT